MSGYNPPNNGKPGRLQGAGTRARDDKSGQSGNSANSDSNQDRNRP